MSKDLRRRNGHVRSHRIGYYQPVAVLNRVVPAIHTAPGKLSLPAEVGMNHFLMESMALWIVRLPLRIGGNPMAQKSPTDSEVRIDCHSDDKRPVLRMPDSQRINHPTFRMTRR